MLVGNKKDQAGDRMVSSEEGFKRSRDIGCQTFHEISVRESIDEVSVIRLMRVQGTITVLRGTLAWRNSPLLSLPSLVLFEDAVQLFLSLSCVQTLVCTLKGVSCVRRYCTRI